MVSKVVLGNVAIATLCILFCSAVSVQILQSADLVSTRKHIHRPRYVAPPSRNCKLGSGPAAVIPDPGSSHSCGKNVLFMLEAPNSGRETGTGPHYMEIKSSSGIVTWRLREGGVLNGEIR
jgi:hypothetical protein